MLFTLDGTRYKVEGAVFCGSQSSPFADNTSTCMDIKVTNLDNHTNLTYSGLVPDLIWRYGFYEGRETKYRVEPKDIVTVFNLQHIRN